MKLVMTLLARDEADVIDANVAFHLNAGVDFMIAMDNLSQDGTTEVLESYARDGHLFLIREESEFLRQADWITRMGRLAATDFGADWIIHSDADEFWWPRGESLRDVLTSVPERYGVVRALLRQFVPRPDDGSFFADRMVVRLSASAPINDPRSLFRPNLKVIHRADPNVNVSIGAQRLIGSSFAPLRGWYPIEFFHFPVRSFEQTERKYERHQIAPEETPSPYYDRIKKLREQGRFGEFYESLVVDEEALQRGLEDGSLVLDTRLRDALRALRDQAGESTREFAVPSGGEGSLAFPRPTVVDEASYAVDVAALGEADVIRLQRRLDTLEQRLLTLERNPALRVYRGLRTAAKKVLRRNSVPAA
jgi:Glycosyl transferase family 2